ncbi:cytohesin-1-like [Hydractinia symbiolongicarpus]|uniref:cytohesin-1-like n=1 Tax=Hydractinia symbiolongicarpus TaxID=13093 RepID=UPI00254CE2C8|nr:cytohesin-1-like [Hydractinia symbiolongicarpus]
MTKKDLTAREKIILQEIQKRKDCLLKEIQQINDEIAEISKEIEIMDQADDLDPQSSKEKLLALGRKKFNINMGKGLEYLYKNKLLNNTPEDVARFLFKNDGLNKIKIGEYLGENQPMQLQVLKEFVALHDFENKSLDAALRDFLWSFRLPGEAQKIDRMMEAFATQYCACNPDQFKTVDTCYVLSFSIIMLNTTLHNPAVKDKMTVDGFVNMNRGINDGGDIPRETMEELFNNILTIPFEIPGNDGTDLTQTFFNPEREGMLTKEGGIHRTWKPRYFILKDNCLFYFRNKGDKEPTGIIPLENLQVRENTEIRRKYCFEIYSPGGAIIKACKTESDGKVVTGHHDIYRICASSAEERDDWIKSIKNSITRDPFYDMLQARKKKATHMQP